MTLTSIPPEPPRNTRLGPYVLIRRIAVGGMAEVFRAEEPKSAGAPRTLVIKRMLGSLAADAEARKMFEDEGRLGARIRHKNVVRVLSTGQAGSTPFLVLEHVLGVDLSRLTRWMTRDGQPLEMPLALYIIHELLQGLSAVHELRDEAGQKMNLVHRDVSPSNVLLSVHGEVKLGDLGIARAALRETHPEASTTQAAKGKLGYLAPEQVRGEHFDQRADLFAAGVIAAELLMGRPLFTGASELAILLAIRDAKIGAFLELMPRLPMGLGEAIVAALARSPEERLSSTEELRSAVADYLDEPPEKMARALGELIAKATPFFELATGGDLRSMAKTIETLPLHEELTPTRATDAQAAEAVEPSYTIRRGSETLGPWRYARVIEAVATGQLVGEDKISKDGEQFVPIESVDVLARHLPASTRTPVVESASAHPDCEAAEASQLAEGGVVPLLARALLEQQSGLLLCENGTVRKEIYLVEGRPVFVTSNVSAELLGEYLVRKGVIERAELDQALAIMPRYEGRLGDTLAALGMVDPVHLFRHIGEQVRGKLLDVFLWEDGHAWLHSGVEPPESSFPLDLDGWEILLTGVERRLDQDLAQDGWDPDSAFELQQPAAANVAERCPEGLRHLLALMESGTTWEHIETHWDLNSPQHSHSLRALTHALIELGAARIAVA